MNTNELAARIETLRFAVAYNRRMIACAPKGANKQHDAQLEADEIELNSLRAELAKLEAA